MSDVFSNLLVVLVFTPVVSDLFVGIVFGCFCIISFSVYMFFVYYGIKYNFNCFYIKEKQKVKIVNNLYIQRVYGYLNVREKITNIFAGDKVNTVKGYVDFIFLNGTCGCCLLKITPFSKDIKVNKEVEVFSIYDKKDIEMFFDRLYKNNIVLNESDRWAIFDNIYNVIKHEDKESFARWLKNYINNYEKYSSIMEQKEKLGNFQESIGKPHKNRLIL